MILMQILYTCSSFEAYFKQYFLGVEGWNYKEGSKLYICSFN